MKHDPDGITLSHLLKVQGVRDREVLEIGCGDGRITVGLAPRVKRLVAVDPDTEALLKARARVPRAEFQRGSGEALAFPDCSFDAVLFTLSLHHQNPWKALRKAARVIKENGTILVLEPVVGTEIERLCRPLEDERCALLDSFYAVLEGPWTIRQKAFFDVQWVFEDREELLRRARHLIESCECDEGCPGCIGPDSSSGDEPESPRKKLVLGLLDAVGVSATH